MDTPTVGSTGSTGQSKVSENNALRDLSMDQFLKLMIAELQNQDPLDPADNHQILQQISEIRSIGASDKMMETLNAVLLGQNVSSASNLIGKNITALDDKGGTQSGRVDKVSIANGKTVLHMGDVTVRLENIQEIVPE